MDNLGSLLPKELARRGLTKQVTAAQIVDFWLPAVTKVCPKALPYTQALTYKDQILTVKCTHSAVAAEVQLCEPALLTEYQKAFPRVKLQLRLQTGARVNRE